MTNDEMTKLRSIWLIIASLLLLAVFETLWLRNVWQEQTAGLQQETDFLFQRTVGALQDSLVRRSMAKNNLSPDSLALPRMPQPWKEKRSMPVLPPPVTFETKTKMIVRLEGKHDDRLLSDSIQYGKVQVFVTTTDSLPSGPGTGVDRLLLNLPTRLRHSGKNEQIFRIQQDTLSIAEIGRVYRHNLDSAGILLPFQLFQADSLPFRPAAGGMTTSPAFAGILVPRFYAAHFSRYQMYLLQKMAPYAAFALLLFGVTITAFYLIYRGLRQQQRLTKLKNEFISNITHELKTPITTVGVALEALSGFDVLQNPEKTREYLAHSKRELDRLSLLVDKVLRLSMFEEQEPHLQPEAVDLAALVRQVMAAMSLQAERTGAHVYFEPDPAQDFTLHADRLHLASVIFNLLDNALKYGGPTPEIYVSLEKTTGLLRLTVRDKGIGIPAEYQPRVFDKFFRVPAGDRHDVKGHGLGLSYVAKVVQQHGGRITVSSEPGAGSVFTVELPV